MTPTHPIKPNPMPAAAAAAPDTQGLQTGLPTVLVWAFRLFVFSIPFETANKTDESTAISVSALAGYLFFLICLCYSRITFPRVHLAVCLFGLYNILRLIYLLFIPSEMVPEAATSVLSMLQLLALMHIGFNLMGDRKLARDFLLTLGVACAALACLQALGITSHSHVDQDRTTALADNPNNVAMILGLGLVALLGWSLGSNRPSPRIALAIAPLLLLISYEIVKTGSRGGFLSLTVGVVMLVLQTNALKSMAARIGLASVLFAVMLLLASTSEYFVSRWSSSIEQGSLANRESIFPITWGLIQERPLTGWGPAHIRAEIGRYFGRGGYDTHNLYLYLLGETGLLGTILYVWALWLCVRAAWRARGGYFGTIPLTLLTVVLLDNMSDTWQFRKLHWLVLAFGLASELSLRKAPSRRSDSAPRERPLNGQVPSARGPEMALPLRRAGA